MLSLPCYKKEHGDLLRSILLDLPIPPVYRQVLATEANRGMEHAITILNIMPPSLKKQALQQMGHKSRERCWKIFNVQVHYIAAVYRQLGCGLVCRSLEDWQKKQWDIATLSAFCHVSAHDLITSIDESGRLGDMRLSDFVNRDIYRNVHMVQLLLTKVPIPVLCTVMCHLHDRTSTARYLDETSSVGLLQYLAAMAASRFAFFMAGMPENGVKHSGNNECVQEPCDPCFRAIMTQMKERNLLHAGLLQAMRTHYIFNTARGGSSRFNLLVACALTDDAVKHVLEEELGRCPGLLCSCRELVQPVEPTGTFGDQVWNSASFLCKMREVVLDKMRILIVAQGTKIESLLDPYNVGLCSATTNIDSILKHIDRQGKLMTLVQNIYETDEQLGRKLASIC